jgi:hypothetical protein
MREYIINIFVKRKIAIYDDPMMTMMTKMMTKKNKYLGSK